MAVAAVVYVGLNYPPSDQDVAGTIVAAKRYRAETIDQTGVQLGDQTVAQLMQTDTFTRLVNDASFRAMAQNAQFLVITHNKRTMAIADSLFGVTMEQPGVSKLVSVRLGDLQPA